MRAWKHIKGGNFWECLGMIVMDLDIHVDCQLADNSQPNSPEKSNFVDLSKMTPKREKSV